MLRSALGYLIKLDYKYHDRIVTALIALLTAGELPFPYQAAATVEAIGRMAPSDPRKIASQLRNLGMVARAHWYLRQKTLEAILNLPYREESAENLVKTALGHENPWVRRAGGALVARGRVPWIRETIENVLIYHPDPELSRIGLYWHRHLTDRDVANREITNLVQSGTQDVTFLRRLKMIYLLRCNFAVAQRLSDYLVQFKKSRSSIVRWHYEQIMSQLQPITQTHTSLRG